MKIIDNKNKIFNSNEFQKDSAKFSLILQNLESESVLLYSDEENYVLCRGSEKYPTWIWTKDGISREKIPEIVEAMKKYLTEADKNKFTCKKEFYEMLIESECSLINKEDYFEMGSLSCEKLKTPKKVDGKMDKPKSDEREILAQYWFDDTAEMNDVEPISMEQARIDIEEMLKADTFYVWRNENEQIVSMVYYRTIGNQARLNHVYTPPKERKKGYAANLIHDLTKELLNKSLVPLLYTDYNYPPSNKAYINVGYEDTGVLINFSCSKK